MRAQQLDGTLNAAELSHRNELIEAELQILRCANASRRVEPPQQRVQRRGQLDVGGAFAPADRSGDHVR